MPKLAALVDGQTEEHFLKLSYPGNEILVMRCLPNGSTVSLERVAEEIIDAVSLLSGDYDRVVIYFDREDREETVEKMEQRIEELTKVALGGRHLMFAIKDIEIENWILADETHMRELIKSEEFTYSREGKAAKKVLNETLKESLSFQKKAQLLKSCYASRIAAASPSFKRFHDSCAALGWWWAAR